MIAGLNDQINDLGGLVMQVNPFHSKRKEVEVYHNNNKCTEGNNIERENLRQGTGGRRLCERCKELNRKGR